MKNITLNIYFPSNNFIDNYLQSLNKKKRDSILVIFNAIKAKSSTINKDGYFDVPSTYLIALRSKYKPFLLILKELGIIEVKTKSTSVELRNQLRFEYSYSEKITESYSTHLGQCKQYRFLINLKKCKMKRYSVNYKTINKEWYNITKQSLLSIGILDDNIRIGRDSFSRRLHHNLTARVQDNDINSAIQKENYKTYLSTHYPNKYVIIDAIACQPTNLPDVLGCADKNYLKALEGDVYNYLMDNLGIMMDRNDAKQLFNLWAMNTGYIDSPLNNLFPIMTKRMLRMKNQLNPKIISNRLQGSEVSFFIDNKLQGFTLNTGLDFALTIHDSFIVKVEDLDVVKSYLEIDSPYQFKVENII